MKKIQLFIIILFSVWSSLGQTEKVIYGNKNNTVFFHLNSPISSAYVGNTDYVFMYDNKNNVKLGVLKILEENTKQTNLLITTKNGLMYSFILQYKYNLLNFNHFLKPKDAINYDEFKEKSVAVIHADFPKKEKNIEPTNFINEDELLIEKDTSFSFNSVNNVKNLYRFNKKKYLRKQANNMINDKPYYFKSLVSRNGLIFRLINIKYVKNELYFLYEIKNKSLMNLDIDMLSYDISSKSRKLRASSQAITQKPIYSFRSPETVKGNTTIRFVAVFNKFTIGKNKVFITSIKENNGERDINLSITPKQINKPN